jgi:hypothetical protein
VTGRLHRQELPSPTTEVDFVHQPVRDAGLDQLRDSFDRRDLGMVLMPGFDRQLSVIPCCTAGSGSRDSSVVRSVEAGEQGVAR